MSTPITATGHFGAHHGHHSGHTHANGGSGSAATPTSAGEQSSHAGNGADAIDTRFSPILRAGGTNTPRDGASEGRMFHRNVIASWQVESPTEAPPLQTASAGGLSPGSTTPTSSSYGVHASPTEISAAATIADTAQAHPSARFGHTAVVDVGDGDTSTMVLFGGRDATSYNNEVWTYDLDRHFWRRPVVMTDLADLTGSPSTTNSGSASGSGSGGGGASGAHPGPGNSVQLVDSANGDGDFHDDGASSTTTSANSSSTGSGGSLSSIANLLDIAGPTPRAGHTAIITEDRKMIVFGGGIDATQCTNDVWELDLKTMKWTKKVAFADPSQVPSPRKGHTAVRHQSSMVVFGGALDAPEGQIWRYNTAKKKGEWTMVTTTGAVPSARQYHTAEIDDAHGSMLVFGGKGNGKFLNDLHELNLATNVWRRIEGTGEVPSGRMCSTSLFRNGVLCVFNGGSTSYFADCFEFDSETETWRRLSPGPVPCTRPTMVLHRNRVTMYGGCAPGHTFLGDVVGMNLEAPSLKEVCREWLRRARHRIDPLSMPERLRVYLSSCE